MRTITIRQLSRNLYKELEDLPIVVTRLGKEYCVIQECTGPISDVTDKSPSSSSDASLAIPKPIKKFKERLDYPQVLKDEYPGTPKKEVLSRTPKKVEDLPKYRPNQFDICKKHKVFLSSCGCS